MNMNEQNQTIKSLREENRSLRDHITAMSETIRILKEKTNSKKGDK